MVSSAVASALFGPCVVGTTSGREELSSAESIQNQRRGCILITSGIRNRVVAIWFAESASFG